MKFYPLFKIKSGSKLFQHKPSHFVYLSLRSKTSKLYVLKNTNFLVSYQSRCKVGMLDETKKYNILSRIREVQNIKKHVPEILYFKGKLFFEYIKDAKTLDRCDLAPKDIPNLKKCISNFIYDLHDTGYVHGDIKNKNILVGNKNNNGYIIDWDNVNILTETSRERDLFLLNRLFVFLDNKE